MIPPHDFFFSIALPSVQPHTRHNCSQAYTLLSFHNPTPPSMIIRFVCLDQFFFLQFIGRQQSQQATHSETDYDSYSTMPFVYLLPGV